MILKKLFASIALILLSILSFGQEREFKKTSIRTFVGVGIYESQQEIGAGLVYSIGYQKTNKHIKRLRINPQLTLGGFQPLFITDLPTQRFRITNLSLNAHYDFIKIDPIDFVVSAGLFGNYTRGYLGNNGYGQTGPAPGLFYKLYYGGTGSIGLRINSKSVIYDFRPINIYYGNKGLGFGFMSFGLDIKLKK